MLLVHGFNIDRPSRLGRARGMQPPAPHPCGGLNPHQPRVCLHPLQSPYSPKTTGTNPPRNDSLHETHELKNQDHTQHTHLRIMLFVFLQLCRQPRLPRRFILKRAGAVQRPGSGTHIPYRAAPLSLALEPPRVEALKGLTREGLWCYLLRLDDFGRILLLFFGRGLVLRHLSEEKLGLGGRVRD